MAETAMAMAVDPIGDAEVRRYHEDGYLVVDDIYTPAEIAQMRQVLDELVEKARHVRTHDAIYDLEPAHTPERPRVRRIKEPFNAHPVYRRMAEHPKLIAVLRRLLGPDLRLHGGKINLKSAGYGSPVEWHQDWAFYPHTNDDVLAVGVMLDDMTMANGPLMVIPGSHKGPTFDHHADGCFVGAIDPAECPVDFGRAVTLTGRAGACSFHHVRMIHGSRQNVSGADRRLLLYQIAAADAWDLRGLPASWEESESRIIAGSETLTPRIVPAPVRLPFPPARRQGSIYENQMDTPNRYFAFDPATGADAAE